MKRTLASLSSCALLWIGSTGAALAHEGHGLPGASHWHGTDVIGYVLAAMILAGLWLSRRK